MLKPGPKSYREFFWRRLSAFGAPPPKFIVAGTGRTGSALIAELLQSAGIACGHESVFTPWGVCYQRELIGDSSWLAVPYLNEFSGHILHLVRSPEKVAQSFLDIGFFDPDTDTAYSRFARRFVPITGNPVDDAFRWYFEWNSRIEAVAHARFDLDDVQSLISHTASLLGVKLPGDAVALQNPVNRKEGSKNRRHAARIEAIADVRLRRDVEAMAARYGLSHSS
ncbi:MAG: hypothetical protein GC166_12180 [Alphaproteobacteria bacterium]|nr:hypothetical protein [Alphaproteobacteria bacterium]